MMNATRMAGAVVLAGVAGVACGERSAPSAPTPSGSPSTQAHRSTGEPAFDWLGALSGEPIEVRRASEGPSVSIFHAGSGDIAAMGDTVEIEFNAAWVGKDGSAHEFDSSAKRGGPLRVPMREGSAVPGLLKGLEGLRVGDVARIEMPAEMGYGKVGRGTIPGGAGLVFGVWVKGIEAAR